VNRSGVSPGTFYNYYRTKEAIFQVVSQDLLERIRSESRAARAQATTAEEFVSLGYEAYLNLLRSNRRSIGFCRSKPAPYPFATLSFFGNERSYGGFGTGPTTLCSTRRHVATGSGAGVFSNSCGRRGSRFPVRPITADEYEIPARISHEVHDEGIERVAGRGPKLTCRASALTELLGGDTAGESSPAVWSVG